MKTGIELIAEERQEQIEKHGRAIQYDVNYNANGQILEAIMLLAGSVGFGRQGFEMPKEAFDELRPSDWDAEICFKMINKPEIDQFKIIGAFAAAEIDRLQNQK